MQDLPPQHLKSPEQQKVACDHQLIYYPAKNRHGPTPVTYPIQEVVKNDSIDTLPAQC